MKENNTAIPADVSGAISWMRFPLMFGVVMIHSGVGAPEGYDVLAFIVRLCTESLPAFCVPMFMAIAGYLFFAKVDTLGISQYVNKLQSRGRSLLIPYVFWNGMVVLMFWAIHRFLPGLLNPEFENVAAYSPLRLLDCWWAGSGGQPIAFQFWFIRDLMVFVVLSPVFYLLFRHTPIAIALFTVAVLFDAASWAWTAYYFALGAWAALQHIRFMDFARRWRMWALAVALVALCGMMSDASLPAVRTIYIMSAGISLLGWSAELQHRIAIPECMSQGSFFLFCVHTIPLMILGKLAGTVLAGQAQWIWIADYFFNPILVCILAIGIYVLLKRVAPRLTSIITGGR